MNRLTKKPDVTAGLARLEVERLEQGVRVTALTDQPGVDVNFTLRDEDAIRFAHSLIRVADRDAETGKDDR
jgi:hypothetical protein